VVVAQFRRMAPEDPLVHVQSAAAAYQNDLSGRATLEAFGPEDGDWIGIATLVDHAATLGEADSPLLIRDAVEWAESLLGEANIVRILGGEPRCDERRSSSEIVRLVAERIERAGALNLSARLLESLIAADRAMTIVDRGRALSNLARIACKMGQTDRAFAIYKRVSRLGAVNYEWELHARAWIGYAAIAQIRGNFPKLRQWATAAAKLAQRHGHRPLARLAYHGLMAGAATARRFDQALVYGWTLLELVDDDDVAMSEVLTSLGQLLLDAGYPEVSRSAFAWVLSRAQPRSIGLPALGGFSVACALLGDRPAVRWAAAELLREARHANQQFDVASSLAECATALSTIGDRAEAVRFRDTALVVSRAHGYHQVTFRAEALQLDEPGMSRVSPTPLGTPAHRLARMIEGLSAGKRPVHVTFAAAGR
jgi:tetratricopeptide (TPR) repeat protein